VAADQVVRGSKDGYTLFMGTVANVINGVMQPNLAFDFSQGSRADRLRYVVAEYFGGASLDRREQCERIDRPAEGKARTGVLRFVRRRHLAASFGRIVQHDGGPKMVHVPYSGSAQAVTDLLAGRTQVMFSPASTVLQYVESGQLKRWHPRNVTRASAAPDLPTVAEGGPARFDTSVWFGFMGPTGLSREVIEKLSRAIGEALGNDEVTKPLHAAGLDIKGGTPEEFGTFYCQRNKKSGTASSQPRVFVINLESESESDMAKLRAVECREFIKAAIEKADEMGVPVSIAVVGPEGNLIALERMDDAGFVTPETAWAKAYTVAAFRSMSPAFPDGLVIQQWFKERNPQLMIAMAVMTNGRVAASGGAAPVFKDNEMVGCYGISGATSDQDELIGQYARKPRPDGRIYPLTTPRTLTSRSTSTSCTRKPGSGTASFSFSSTASWRRRALRHFGADPPFRFR